MKSIHRSFNLADNEIRRDEIDNKVFGYLDLTPYNSCDTHHVGFSKIELILSPRFKFLETKIVGPEQYNKTVEKIRAEAPPDA